MLRRLTLALLLAPLPALPAQTATVAGAVLDSLNGGFLRGAEVVIAGSTLGVTTDSSGRFGFSGIRPGTIQIGVFHPLLDSLGISLGTRPFQVHADSATVVILSVPSPRTIVSRLCAPEDFRRGPAVVSGRVIDPDTEEPLRFARVSVAWVDYDVTKSAGLVRSPNERHAYTDSIGRFGICGLPADLDARIQATRTNASTPELTFAMGSRPVSLHTLAIPSDAAPRAPRAVVSGRVVGPDGEPITNARIEVPGGGSTRTTAGGEFSLSGLHSGTQLMHVRAIGFAAAAVPVQLTAREPRRVSVTLQRFVAIMDPVLVTARRERALGLVGFTARRKSGLGKYLTREEIERRNAGSFTDLLRMMPGVRIAEVDGRMAIQSTRGANSPTDMGCVRFVVDGVEWPAYSPGDMDGFLPPAEIAAMEVYSPSTTPMEYATRGQGCTTVVVWSRTRVHDR